VRVRRFAGLLAAACLAGALPAGAALADGDGDGNQNLATAIVQQDGAYEFDFAWDFDRQRGGTVDHLNQARALARCSDCKASSIAFQIVLVSGGPDRVEPRNSAIALNDGCERCVTYAGARQFVRVTPERVRLTGSGRRTLADVRDDLRDLDDPSLTVDQLAAAVEQQEARVLEVLDTQLVPAGRGEDDDVGRVGEDDDEDDDEG
jgi:putative peptide zinc metalloprotease protein